MPNWVLTNLKIAGAELPDFLAELFGAETKIGIKNVRLLESFLPTPELSSEENGLPAWYTWRLENWGTKWDAVIKNIEIDIASRMLSITCEFANSLPIEWALTVSKRYPSLTFTFDEVWEETGLFWGHIAIGNGNVIDDQIHIDDEANEVDIDYHASLS
ncbi:hypothetical protein QYE77_15265 (plasmid) [Thermanaerothrix sp. 4228-RoL]|jgi:hypothetical protein|uniref:YubB ferredoxin-like domain-containing protein n=1 Tax=Thermanaerothrix solaris TaxID=3058434 RepID=A0ABU3NS23_9CHLR|nr:MULTISPECIES: hypothetical protein [unclassified Thermanaerothrix]MDT8899624.1 hypothetical protein [Thermanaerothrix sp. 4228-RoL]